MRKLFCIIALVVTTSSAHADPHTDVEGVAAVIEANYFDERRAAQIASDLRKSATSGEFDRYAEQSDLASELTQRLRKLDGHFGVRWNPEEPPSREPRPPRTEPPPESRTNYGFRRVERLPGNIGYIELTYAADIDFSQSDSPPRRAADAALAMMRDADAVILDVRANGGGAPSMVGYLISAFVDSKADIYNTFYSREGTQSERPAEHYPAPMLSVPLYVLASGQTGSAAESIAFTLQSAKRAQIVGERSAGAANPGRPFRTPQGYSVFVATGAPRNPINGRNWEGEGVKPDVEVTSERALQRAQEVALEKILSGSIAGAARTDVQWTLEALRAPSTVEGELTGVFGPYTFETTAEGRSGNIVSAKVARWPAMRLLPIRRDLFYFAGNPSRRVGVERKDGKVVAVTLSDSDGSERRLRRSEP
jgi:hypothetical protein